MYWSETESCWRHRQCRSSKAQKETHSLWAPVSSMQSARDVMGGTKLTSFRVGVGKDHSRDRSVGKNCYSFVKNSQLRLPGQVGAKSELPVNLARTIDPVLMISWDLPHPTCANSQTSSSSPSTQSEYLGYHYGCFQNISNVHKHQTSNVWPERPIPIAKLTQA